MTKEVIVSLKFININYSNEEIGKKEQSIRELYNNIKDLTYAQLETQKYMREILGKKYYLKKQWQRNF